MTWIAVLLVAISGVVAWFLDKRWLQNVSPKGRLYITCGGAFCMAGLFILAPSENVAQYGILMAILFAFAIALRMRDLYKARTADL